MHRHLGRTSRAIHFFQGLSAEPQSPAPFTYLQLHSKILHLLSKTVQQLPPIIGGKLSGAALNSASFWCGPKAALIRMSPILLRRSLNHANTTALLPARGMHRAIAPERESVMRNTGYAHLGT